MSLSTFWFRRAHRDFKTFVSTVHWIVDITLDGMNGELLHSKVAFCKVEMHYPSVEFSEVCTSYTKPTDCERCDAMHAAWQELVDIGYLK